MDESLPEAHASLAYAKLYYDWDWPGAEKEFKRSIELNPAYATARMNHSLYLTIMRLHQEALAEAEKARELDPLSLIINANIALVLYFAHRYDQVIAQCRTTLEMDPNFVVSYAWLGQAYLQKGATQEAIGEFRKAVDLSEASPFYVGRLAHAYAVAGDAPEAERLLDRLRAQSAKAYVSSYGIAEVYGQEPLQIAKAGKKSAATAFQNAEGRALAARCGHKATNLLPAPGRYYAVIPATQNQDYPSHQSSPAQGGAQSTLCRVAAVDLGKI